MAESRKDHEGMRQRDFRQLKYAQESPDCSRIAPEFQIYCFLLGKTNTRAETAEFFNVPPSTSGPSGVNKIPRESARTSYVSSVTISQRFPCNSNANVTGESSAGFPSLSRPL